MTAKITYFALKAFKVGDTMRQPGDLVPEATQWRHVTSRITDGYIAPIPVWACPKAVRDKLALWESLQANAVTDTNDEDETVEPETPVVEDDTVADSDEEETA